MRDKIRGGFVELGVDVGVQHLARVVAQSVLAGGLLPQQKNEPYHP